MLEFLSAGLLSCVLIVTSGMIMYEALRQVWNRLPHLKWPPQLRIMAVISVVFLANIVNIWIFGLAYYFIYILGFGTMTGGDIIKGDYALDVGGFLYFSAATYSTLGLGDITPLGAERMLTSAEALTGFVMVGWTASFSYLAMEKFWQLPHVKASAKLYDDTKH